MGYVENQATWNEKFLERLCSPGAGLFTKQNWVIGREKAGDPGHPQPRINIEGQILQGM